MNKTILEQLDWNTFNKKNWCAKNTRIAFWIYKSMWNAHEWTKYIDTKTPKIWHVAVIDKWTWWGRALNTYWHVAVVTEIDLQNNRVKLYDWPNAYNFWSKLSTISWFISPEKMIKLGSTIIIPKDVETVVKVEESEWKSWKYEEIYNKLYPNGWTIFNDMKWAKESLWDVAFFTAIWLERVKKDCQK